MKNIKLTLIFGLLSTHLYSQGIVNGTSDSTSMNYRSIHLKSNYNLFIGCDIGYMVSTYSDIPNIPVQIEYLSSAHVQLSGIIEMSNKGFIKTGLSTHYLRSGLIDGEYHYNSYSSIPFVVTYKRFRSLVERAASSGPPHSWPASVRPDPRRGWWSSSRRSGPPRTGSSRRRPSGSEGMRRAWPATSRQGKSTQYGAWWRRSRTWGPRCRPAHPSAWASSPAGASWTGSPSH